MALALAGRFEPFSQGRGFITPERVEEMETIAARHGIFLAPLYNADGPVEDGLHCQTEWSRVGVVLPRGCDANERRENVVLPHISLSY
jgi:hypothetical protein